jgi:hypothetical protein
MKLIIIVVGLLLGLLETAEARDWTYVVLGGRRMVVYQRRYVDTLAEGQYVGGTFSADNARLYLRMLNDSPARGFFAPTAPYTHVVVPIGSLMAYYAHYVVEAVLTAEQAWDAHPEAAWKDVSRSVPSRHPTAGVTFLTEFGLVAGAWQWDFARYGFHALYQDDRSGNSYEWPLARVRASDVHSGIGSHLEKVVAKTNERRAIDVPAFVREHRRHILTAARRLELHPEVIAALLLAEQRDQNPSRPHTLPGVGRVTAASETWDWLASWAGKDPSIGLGQVRASTVKENNLIPGVAKGKSLGQIQTLLWKPEHNIPAAAEYMRIVANGGARYRGKLPEGTDNQKYFRSLRLADFSRHSLDWTMGHLYLLGSEYTSSPWDGKYQGGWGLHVLKCYADVLDTRAF